MKKTETTDTKPAKKRLELGKIKINFKFSPDSIMWFLFAGIILVELVVAYNSIFRNLVFSDPSEEAVNTAVVRVNFVNYEKAVKRLDETYLFVPSQNIDFAGEDGIGRSNPFADPQ